MRAPLVIEFIDGSYLERDEAVVSALPIVGNGPPGTRVVFADGWKINLPTDQIVDAEVVSGRARVSFGGMRWAGAEDRSLAFVRVKDLWSPERLSPERGVRMTLERARVAGAWQEEVSLLDVG